MLTRTPTCPPRAAAILIALLLGGGIAAPARADDDDLKPRDRKPSVVHPIMRSVAHDPNAAPTDGPFPAHNVILKSWIPLSNFAGYAGGSGADCWGYTSPSGREYALMGLSWGNGIVEVTNPANPVILTTIPGSVNSLWRDIAVVGTRAYAVSDGTGVGIQVMNLANIDQGQVTLIGNYAPGGLTTSHTLLQNAASGYVYGCGTNVGGFLPLSTTGPGGPVPVGPGWTTDYVHECQVVTYTAAPYAGREIAFLFTAGSGIAIVDVTNKSAPVTLSHVQYPALSYSHQGWLSNNGKYMYHDDELDGAGVPAGLTRIFDVSNLSNPRLCAAFSDGRPAIDHNQYVSGAYLFQSNYTAGLRVWDLTEPLRPYEIAWFDTRPEDDAPTFNGDWGNYAFFPSGTVLASDLERGLFVLRVSLLKIKFPTPPPGTLVAGDPTPITAQIAVRDATLNSGSVKLNVSVNNGGWSAIPMAAQGAGLFKADIPAQACAARVRFYVSALTSDDRMFTGPATAPGEFFGAVAQAGEIGVFADDFENNLGWTAANAVAGTTGKWVRTIPSANAGHGAAIGDADGSGRCFVTGNLPNEEVNGGPTRLTSPEFDLAAHPEAIVSYSYWLLSIQGTTDLLRTEVSDNGGTTWKLVRDTGPSSGGWQRHSFRVADYAAPTPTVRVRFSVGDTGTDSLTEAGIDAFSIVSPRCTAPCYADCNTDGALTVADFGCFQTGFVVGAPYADCNGDQQLTVADFGCFQTKFVLGCP